MHKSIGYSVLTMHTLDLLLADYRYTSAFLHATFILSNLHPSRKYGSVLQALCSDDQSYMFC